jgi:hypothetical protein
VASDDDVADPPIYAVIASAAPLDVRFAPSHLRYEVRQLGDEVGRLELLRPQAAMATRATAHRREWRFEVRKRKWGWEGVAQIPQGTDVATYRIGKLPRRGTITASGAEYELRAPWLSDVWNLRGEGRAPVARLRHRARLGQPLSFSVELEPEGVHLIDLPLLILFAIWAVLVEADVPTVDGGPAGG